MTSMFKSLRFTGLFFGFCFATVVVGLSANFASVFLPLHQDFLVFAIVVSAVTMIFIIVISLRSTPSYELFFMFVFAILWLAMGGYSTDVIGHVECDSLRGTIPAHKNTTYSATGYCRQMKVLQSFSWAEFLLFTIMFFIVLQLGLNASARGYNQVWNGSISELGWFGEETGHSSGHQGQAQYYQNGAANGANYTYPAVTSFGNSQPVYQLPGHSVVISNGQITQVPVQPVPGAPRSTGTGA